MSFEIFVARNFSAGTLALIEYCNTVIDEYEAQGFRLTLRQLYYQMVARGIIENKQTEYKRLGSIVNDGRLAGLIDWSAIEDRTRNVKFISSWQSPQEILSAVASQYQEDLWRLQDYRVEVWIEKEALIGVVEPACERLRVPYFACRGYVSQSEAYAAGERFRKHLDAGQSPVILHLGDHDPSGLDMTRDNAERLAMFTGQPVEVVRLALNMDQIERLRPPPNPAKETDARFASYLRTYGDQSWELDALPPDVIDKLISDAVAGYRSEGQWRHDLAAEETEREHLEKVAGRWDDVSAWLEETPDDE
jgi:hypothetical protein